MEKRKRLFILDDDPEELWIFREVFEAKKLEVKTASEIGNLFHDVVQFAPDVLLIDVKLKNYDGRTLCYHLRNTEITKGIPIIMMSDGDLNPKDGVFCKADYMIKKPFKVSELIKYIDTLTNHNSLGDVN